MKKLSAEQKAALKEKIAEQRTQKNHKEQKLLAYKQQYKRYGGASGGVGGTLQMGGSRNAQSYTSRLTAAKREQAFSHVFDKDEPLRPMELSNAQKAALKRKLAEEQKHADPPHSHR